MSYNIDSDLDLYFCLKCKRIHKRLYQSKDSIIFIEHFCYKSQKERLTDSQLFKIDFKKKWKTAGERKKI